jgi:hypothetical protein
MRLSIILLAALAAMTLAGGSVQARKAAAPNVIPPAPAGLRGAVGADVDRPAKLISPLVKIARPALSLASGAAGAGDLQICRQACAHSYYYCLAGDQPDNCPGAWTECLAKCTDAELAR